MGGDDYVIDEKRGRAWGNVWDALNWYRARVDALEGCGGAQLGVDLVTDAEKVLREVWAIMAPAVPPCCNGCNAEWDIALRAMRRYFGLGEEDEKTYSLPKRSGIEMRD